MWRRLKTPIAVLGLRLYTVHVVLVGRWGNVGPTGECRVSFRHIRGPRRPGRPSGPRSDTSRDGSAGTRVPLYRGSRVSRARRAAVSLCLYPGISRVTGESPIYHASFIHGSASFSRCAREFPSDGVTRTPQRRSARSTRLARLIHI